jgi:hypothetical protein
MLGSAARAVARTAAEGKKQSEIPRCARNDTGARTSKRRGEANRPWGYRDLVGAGADLFRSARIHPGPVRPNAGWGARGSQTQGSAPASHRDELNAKYSRHVVIMLRILSAVLRGDKSFEWEKIGSGALRIECVELSRTACYGD